MTFGPPGRPAGVRGCALRRARRVDLTWTNPRPTAGRPGRAQGRLGAGSPTDGTLVFTGTGTSVSDTGLTNGTAYFYGVWVEARSAIAAARRRPRRRSVRGRPGHGPRARPRATGVSTSPGRTRGRLDRALGDSLTPAARLSALAATTPQLVGDRRDPTDA